MAKRPRAIIFDLGGTLVDWQGWFEDADRRWGLAYDYLCATAPNPAWPSRTAYVAAMRAAEAEHWRRVTGELWSGSSNTLVEDGFRRLDLRPTRSESLAALDGYAQAVAGWAVAFPDARPTLQYLRDLNLRIGLLSNTWWAAAWHNADLAAHGLIDLLDTVVYTSDLPHSKPHPSVFVEAATRLKVDPAACVMVGDQMGADISGALAVGMRAVWKRNQHPWPASPDITPTAEIDCLADLPPLITAWLAADR